MILFFSAPGSRIRPSQQVEGSFTSEPVSNVIAAGKQDTTRYHEIHNCVYHKLIGYSIYISIVFKSTVNY